MYKIFKVELNNGNMDVDLPEGYDIQGVLSSSDSHAVLVLRKILTPERPSYVDRVGYYADVSSAGTSSNVNIPVRGPY